jgi:hypothetical protein
VGKAFFLQPTAHNLQPSLLDFAMHPMLAAKRAELLHFQPLSHGLLVLGLAIVLSLAFGALKCNDFSHI